MTDDERRAAMAEALERSRVMLDPDACSEAIAAETVTRVHRTDGFAHDWAASMPRKELFTHNEKTQRRTLTDAEALRWRSYIDGKIAAAIAERDDYWRDVLAGLVSEVRKQLRAEIVEQVGGLRADVEIATKAADRGHDRVIDLPALPLRSVRRG